LPLIGRLLLAGTVLALLTGCGTLPNGRLWGEGATFRPGWNRVETAARKALQAPQTWASLAGAAVFSLADWDQRVSDWAVDHHPIFGSTSKADSASDVLAYTTGALWGATVLVTADGAETGPWVGNKAKGAVTEGSALLAAQGMSEGLKRATHRPRPDRSDNKSFPSGHATQVASFATLAYRNLATLPISEGGQLAAGVGLGGLAVATGWARIEAGRHFPSDVLAGAALGYFFSAFFNDAFLGLDAETPLRPSLDLSRGSAIFRLAWGF